VKVCKNLSENDSRNFKLAADPLLMKISTNNKDYKICK